MATVEFWIQIENHAWDITPNNIDRMSRQSMQAMPRASAPVVKTSISPETGVKQTSRTR